MSLSKLVVFDRPLVGATAVARARTRSVSEAELMDMREQSRREGSEETRHFADSQMVEMRSEVQQLNESLFESLRQAEVRLADQVRAASTWLARMTVLKVRMRCPDKGPLAARWFPMPVPAHPVGKSTDPSAAPAAARRNSRRGNPRSWSLLYLVENWRIIWPLADPAH
jgi:hypothetical protein